MSGHAEAGFSNAKRNLSEDIDDDARNAPSKRRRLSFHHLDGGIGQEARSRRRHDEYTIGWICALHIEMAASSAMLDRIHGNIPTKANDSNEYILGSIGPHNIVMACLPSGQYGTNNAATVAGNMMRSFESIRFGLMVGIGGGVPGGDGISSNIDIRLGDVVVGNKVLQSDLGKIGLDGVFRGTGIPRIPPPSLLNAVSKLRTLHEERDSRINSILREMHEHHPRLAVEYAYPAGCEDRLFRATYKHNPSGDQTEDCSHCNPAELQHRISRTSREPRIHYGSIASSNQVMKWGPTRDALAKQLNVICFEMEAAGLMDSFPCIVIRGICDYADSHKSKQWQKYAAATAAAYAKELVSTIAPRSHLKADYSRPQEIVPERTQNEVREHQRALLKSLRFERIDARFANIRTAHKPNCELLLNKDSYQEWLKISRVTQHHGFLWVSGKPGVEKSTITKFALSHAENMKLSDNNTAIISFFFNARGDSLEKSTYGLHRSLLYQLLRSFPDLRTVFDDSSIIPSDQKSCPTINTVQDLFRKAILALGQRHLTCFIDAIDECDEEEVQDLIFYFDELGDEAIENDVWLKICFSSRHYPDIYVRHGLKLVLEIQPGHSVATMWSNLSSWGLSLIKRKVGDDKETTQGQRSNERPKHDSRDFSFRIDEIPAGTSRSILEANFRTLEAIASPILKDVLGTLAVRSLATRDAHFACATVTVIITIALSEADLFRSLHKALRIVGLSYRCDCDFLGVTPLHDNEAGANACDLIAVPGLASHAFGSWKTQRENDIWLRDWLPKDIPNVRVLLYGHNTAPLQNESMPSIEDLSWRFLESVTTFRQSTNTQNRPVIFIGHSLGGLLIKEALVQAYRSPDFLPIHKPLYKNCSGIIFFGVPHLGVRNEALRNLVGGQPNQALVDSIVVDNESKSSHFLARISDDFARCFHGEMRVVSFYECQRSPTFEMHNGKLSRTGPKVLMVTPKSAMRTGITGVSEEDNIPLNETHSGLVKFQSRGQHAYRIVTERIRSLVSKAASVDSHDDADVETPRRETLRSFNINQGGSHFNGPITMAEGGSLTMGNQSNVHYYGRSSSPQPFGHPKRRHGQ